MFLGGANRRSPDKLTAPLFYKMYSILIFLLAPKRRKLNVTKKPIDLEPVRKSARNSSSPNNEPLLALGMISYKMCPKRVNTFIDIILFYYVLAIEAGSMTVNNQIKIWEKFCVFTNKTENFEENEVIGFLESMSSTKSVRLDNFKLELMNIYFIKTGRNFNVDFPKVDAFVLEKMVVTTVKNSKPVSRWIKPKSEGENDDLNYTKRMEWLWNQLCSKFDKMENFIPMRLL